MLQRPSRYLCVLLLACASGCERDKSSTAPEATSTTSDRADSSEQDATIDDVVSELSKCRSGRIQLPSSKAHLRAVRDDEHGFLVLLPDLNDWDMACGDKPYLVANALGGAITVTVDTLKSPEPLTLEAYLRLFDEKLTADLDAQGMQRLDHKLDQSPQGTWRLTFKVVSNLQDAEVWQFNYITVRAPGGASETDTFVTLHIAVTALHDAKDDEQVAGFAEGLETYLDLFRVD